MKVNKALYMNNGMIDGNKLNQNYDEILMKGNPLLINKHYLKQ